MRVESHPCYVLHQRPYRETSLLLEIFSSSHGRSGLVARGAKRPKSEQAVLLQPFRRLSLAWSGRGELGLLTSVEPDGTAGSMNAGGLIAGFYINELVVRLLHRHESHPDLFAAYENVLAALSDDRDNEIALRCFETRLLQTIGYGLVLDHDVETSQPIAPERSYQYVSEQGPCRDRQVASACVSVQGSTLIDLAAGRFRDERSLREAKHLLRQELAQHLGPRPLASRALYQSYLANRRLRQELSD